MQLKSVFRTLALITAFLLMVSMASTALAQNSVTQQNDSFKITYLGMTDNGDGTSTWSYKVEELRSGKGFKDLSHWALGLGSCAEVISADPSNYEIGKDRRTGVDGIKWDLNDSFTSGEFSFTVNGVWAETQVYVGTKAGRGVERSYITGPSCDPATGDDDSSDDEYDDTWWDS